MPLEVDCLFTADGRVRVRRIRLDGRWRPAQPGRQWRDGDGRHILLLIDGRPYRLTLGRETLDWSLRPSGQDRTAV